MFSAYFPDAVAAAATEIRRQHCAVFIDALQSVYTRVLLVVLHHIASILRLGSVRGEQAYSAVVKVTLKCHRVASRGYSYSVDLRAIHNAFDLVRMCAFSNQFLARCGKMRGGELFVFHA